MATNYDNLLNDPPVVLMAQNRTLPTNMPILIRQAEDEVCARLDHDAFRSTVQTPIALVPGTPTFDLRNEPNAVYEVRAVEIDIGGQTVVLEQREIGRLTAVFASGETGVPRFYAEDEEPLMFRVFPAPDTTYPVRIKANIAPPSLGPSQQTNVLTQRFPRLIEMAVFKHASRFQRNQVDEARYAEQFELALTEANQQIARNRRDETTATVSTTSNRGG